MKTSWLVVLALAPAVVLAAQDYAWQWPLAPEVPEASAYRVPLDAAVYRAAWWPDLRDVRVIDADGRAVPSIVRPAVDRAPVIREEDVPWFTLPQAANRGGGGDLNVVVQRDRAGQVLSIRNQPARTDQAAAPDPALLVDLGQDPARVRALRLEPGGPARDIDVAYRIEASADLRNWSLLDAGARLVALRNQGQELRNDRVPLDTRLRYVRLTPLQDAGTVVRGIRAEVSEPQAGPEWQWLDAVAQPPVKARDGDFRYRVAGRFPAQRLRLTLPANSSVRWRVSASDDVAGRDAPDWRVVAFDWTTWRLADKGAGESPPLVLPAPESAHRWRLQQVGPASALPSAPRLELGYRAGDVVFLAQGRSPYRLVAGRADAAVVPDVVQPVLAAMRVREGAAWEPPVAAAGAASELAGAAAYRPAPKPVDWKQWILWGVLMAGALVVAAFALRLLRENRRPDSGPGA